MASRRPESTLHLTQNVYVCSAQDVSSLSYSCLYLLFLNETSLRASPSHLLRPSLQAFPLALTRDLKQLFHCGLYHWQHPGLSCHSRWAYYPIPRSSLVLSDSRPVRLLQRCPKTCQSLPSLPRLPGRILIPQFPNIAIASPRQICWVHRDEVIGSFTLLSLPARQEEHLKE